MHVDFSCPACESDQRVEVAADQSSLSCGQCDWKSAGGAAPGHGEHVEACPVCGCDDMWRQKDFPPALGLTMVGLGILLSTLAWADLRPVLAIGVLMGFALVDLLLYALMPDVLVCYRCGARVRRTDIAESHPRFDLEIHERYRQESLRMETAVPRQPQSEPGTEPHVAAESAPH